MSKTLILNFHPDPANSRANAALAAAAAQMPGVEVVTMAGERYGGPFDYTREVERLAAADRLVLQFPVYWYAAPALMAEWMAQILTVAFYVRAREDGARIEGRQLADCGGRRQHARELSGRRAHRDPAARTAAPTRSHRAPLRARLERAVPRVPVESARRRGAGPGRRTVLRAARGVLRARGTRGLTPSLWPVRSARQRLRADADARSDACVQAPLHRVMRLRAAGKELVCRPPTPQPVRPASRFRRCSSSSCASAASRSAGRSRRSQ